MSWKNKVSYWKGKKIKYIGTKETLYGGMFWQAEILEGHEKGRIVDINLCPSCGMFRGQDHAAADPCFECMPLINKEV